MFQAELVDALRKRRNRPDASDEDLGLPRSPTTPQRKDNVINHSEGSLSLLSMVSSDMDDESMVTTAAAAANSSGYSFASSKFSSQNTSQNSDEVDLDASVSSTGSRLSHSAARHKMAIRPKKKGPTRHRQPKEVSKRVHFHCFKTNCVVGVALILYREKIMIYFYQISILSL